MDAERNGESRIPSHPDVPKDATAAAMEAQKAASAEEAARVAKRAARLDELTKARSQRLSDFLGPERAAALGEFLTTHRKQAEAKLEKERPERAEKVRKELERESRAALNAFGQKQGIDFDALLETLQDGEEEIAEAMRVDPGKKAAQPIPEEEVPKDIRDQSHNPPVVFRAPYPGWAYSWSWSSTGYSWSGTHFLRNDVGEIGNQQTFVTTTNGGNYSGSAQYRASVGVWFQMPTAGRIEAWFELEGVGGNHDQWMRWDYIFPWSWPRGTSRLDVNFVMTTVGQRSGSSSEIPAFLSGQSQVYPRAPSIGGTTGTWVHLYSDRVYEPGEWVLVWGGIRTDLSSSSNDIHLRNGVNQRSLLRSARIQSTGG